MVGASCVTPKPRLSFLADSSHLGTSSVYKASERAQGFDQFLHTYPTVRDVRFAFVSHESQSYVTVVTKFKQFYMIFQF